MERPRVSARRLHAFLADPRSYPTRPARVEVVQTHASYVALTPGLVFKVKKSVNFGFLDFSTLEKRHHFCRREVELNRRLCPGVHRGVRAITLQRGRLAFDGPGAVVEYAVVMRRLAPSGFLLHRLQRGKAGRREVDAVVSKLAAFYRAQTPSPAVAAWGRVARLRVSTDENFRQMRAFVGETITPAAAAALRHYTRACYRAHAALFERRVRDGHILDCHGDLHLEHIHFGPRGVAIYDCIEFNDRFRSIDVASDAAFLAMDFDFHGRPDLARHFTTRLAAALDDPGMLALLDFYQCYRACVRGKVESLRHAGRDLSGDEYRDSGDQAARYFRLALRYALAGSAPTVLVVMGRAGSGKSTLAAALGRELGWPVYSSDHVRKELAGVPLHERGSAATRRRLYSARMTARTYAALARHAREAVRAHGAVILDATFGSRRRRDAIRTLATRLSAACHFVEAQAPGPVVLRRLTRRASSAHELSDARVEDLPTLERSYEAPARAEQTLPVKTAAKIEQAVTTTLRALVARHVERAHDPDRKSQGRRIAGRGKGLQCRQAGCHRGRPHYHSPPL